MIALNGLVIVLVQPLALGALLRLPRHVVLAGGALFIGIGFGLTGLAASGPAFALTVVIWTLGEIANAATGPAVVADLTPAHLRGTYQGTYGAAWGGALAAGPAAGTFVFDSAGGALWPLCLVIGVAAAFGLYLSARHAGPGSPAVREELTEKAKESDRYHGIVIVKVRDGRISHWREYQYRSTLDWPAFAGDSAF